MSLNCSIASSFLPMVSSTHSRLLTRSFLRFFNGLGNFTRLKIQDAHLIPDGQIGRVFLHALLAFGDLVIQLFGGDLFLLFDEIRRRGIELLQLVVKSAD